MKLNAYLKSDRMAKARANDAKAAHAAGMHAQHWALGNFIPNTRAGEVHSGRMEEMLASPVILDDSFFFWLSSNSAFSSGYDKFVRIVLRQNGLIMTDLGSGYLIPLNLGSERDSYQLLQWLSNKGRTWRDAVDCVNTLLAAWRAVDQFADIRDWDAIAPNKGFAERAFGVAS